MAVIAAMSAVVAGRIESGMTGSMTKELRMRLVQKMPRHFRRGIDDNRMISV